MDKHKRFCFKRYYRVRLKEIYQYIYDVSLIRFTIDILMIIICISTINRKILKFSK